MRYSKSEVKAGLVIVAALVVFTMLCYLILDLEDYFKTKMLLLIDFSTAPGVKEGTPVRYAGVEKGRVISDEFVWDETQKTNIVRTVCQIDGELRLTDKDVVYVEERLTGNVWIEIRPGREGGPPETVYMPGVSKDEQDKIVLLKGRSSPLAQVFEGARDLLASANELLQGEERENFNQAIAGVRQLVDRGNEVADSLQKLVSEDGTIVTTAKSIKNTSDGLNAFVEENRQDVKSVMGHLNDVIPRIGETSASFEKAADEFDKMISENREAVKETMVELKKFPGKFDALIRQAAEAIDMMEMVIVENRPIVKQTFVDMSDAVANFKLGIERLKRQPWRLIYRPTEDEHKEVVVYETARNLLEAQGGLERALNRLGTADLDEVTRQEFAKEIRRYLANISAQLDVVEKDMNTEP